MVVCITDRILVVRSVSWKRGPGGSRIHGATDHVCTPYFNPELLQLLTSAVAFIYLVEGFEGRKTWHLRGATMHGYYFITLRETQVLPCMVLQKREFTKRGRGP